MEKKNVLFEYFAPHQHICGFARFFTFVECKKRVKRCLRRKQVLYP